VEAERELKQVALDFGCSLLVAANGLKQSLWNYASLAQDNDRELTNPKPTFKMRSMS